MRKNWFKSASDWLNSSGWGNLLTILALALSMYVAIDTKSIERRNDLMQLMDIKVQLRAMHGRTMENAGIASMKLMMITEAMSPQCVASRDSLLTWVPTLGALAEAGNESVEGIWHRFLAENKTLDDPEFDGDQLPIAVTVQGFLSDATDGEFMSQRMLSFTEVILHACEENKTPPPLPSDIVELMNTKRQSTSTNLHPK